jgi:uncharacterized membrane protein
MTLPNIFLILQWWFFLFVIGIGFLPLAAVLFKPFKDKGYVFAKPLGVAILSYAIFCLGTFRLVPFNQISLILILLFLFGCVYYFFAKHAVTFTREVIFLFVLEELLFLAGLFFLSYIRSFNPEIHGLEKFMDFGFINSILRSEFFPPKDMWFAPHSINYYYFGHFASAVLTKLSALPSYISYNLMLATVFACCFVGSFSIAINLYVGIKKHVSSFSPKLIGSGLITAFLVTLSGNLHVLYTFFKAYSVDKPVPFWELSFLPNSFPNNYWYPNATRFIHNTIHEFPMYSWTVADLHGHVADIAFVLLTIGLLLSLFMQATQNTQTTYGSGIKNALYVAYWKKHLLTIVALSFLIAVMYMTNAWDGLIYLMLSGLVFFTLSYLVSSEQSLLHRLQSAIIGSVIPMATFVSLFALFTLPFSLNFQPGSLVSGIGVLCAPTFLTDLKRIGPFLFEANHCQRSPLWQLFILYGFFYFFALTFLTFLARAKKITNSDIFVFILLILGCLLINIPEFLYAKDIYPEHYRANTMFKLVFQSFILLSLVSGYVLIRIISLLRTTGVKAVVKIGVGIWSIIAWVLLSIVFIYPFMAINSYYNNLRVFQGLDGLAYLKTLRPDDYEVITWINRNIQGQPVILEAQGDSYTDYARVSANTGLPTVLGWTVHEWLWRGSYDIPAPRIAEIQTLYETSDIKRTKALLDKYDIAYVYVGNLEREKYSKIDEKKWEELGKPVYKSGNTMLYKITK